LRLCAAVGDDEVGGDTEEEPGGEHVEAEGAVSVAAHGGPDLADHVEDRAACERLEGELERVGVDLVADDGAYERRAGAHQAGGCQPFPGGPHASERSLRSAQVPVFGLMV
jgi:hypothetical protein